MTTSSTTLSLSDMLSVRALKHNEATTLLSQIEAAQNTITSMQDKLTKMNLGTTYYKPVADVYMAEIEKQATIRNEAVVKYNRIMWSLFKADLPLISNTSVQEISTALYSSTITSAQA